jgi:hypothetical protein
MIFKKYFHFAVVKRTPKEHSVGRGYIDKNIVQKFNYYRPGSL